MKIAAISGSLRQGSFNTVRKDVSKTPAPSEMAIDNIRKQLAVFHDVDLDQS